MASIWFIISQPLLLSASKQLITLWSQTNKQMKKESNGETFYAIYEIEKGTKIVKYSNTTPNCTKLTTLISSVILIPLQLTAHYLLICNQLKSILENKEVPLPRCHDVASW